MASTSNWLSDISYSDIKDASHVFKLVEDRKWKEVIECSSNEKSEQVGKWIVRRKKDLDIIWRRLPIHEASMRNPTKQAIMSLIDAYPNGVRVADNLGRLALHHAVVHGASEEVIVSLIMAYPESMDAEDMWGKTPISNAYASSSDEKNAILIALEKSTLYYAQKITEKKFKALNKKQEENFESRIIEATKRHSSVTAKLELNLEKERSSLKALQGKLSANEEKVRQATSIVEVLEERVEKLSELEETVPLLMTKLKVKEKTSALLKEKNSELEAQVTSLSKLPDRINDLESQLEENERENSILTLTKSKMKEMTETLAQDMFLLSEKNGSLEANVREQASVIVSLKYALRDMEKKELEKDAKNQSFLLMAIIAEYKRMNGITLEQGENIRTVSNENEILLDALNKQNSALMNVAELLEI